MDTLSHIRHHATLLAQSSPQELAPVGWKATTGYDPNRVCLFAERHGEAVVLGFDGGVLVRFHHQQDCCEQVELVDICGDLSDLVGHVLPVLELRTQRASASQCDDSETWSFVTLRGPMGSVDLRWHGSSNGYYSEEVNVEFWAPAQDLSITAHQLLGLRAGKGGP